MDYPPALVNLQLSFRYFLNIGFLESFTTLEASVMLFIDFSFAIHPSVFYPRSTLATKLKRIPSAIIL
jgi:hypothetical protein